MSMTNHAVFEGMFHRALHPRFVEGWFETLIGKVIAVGVPVLGMDRALQRLPRSWSAGQPDLKMEMRKVAERHWRRRSARRE